MKQIFFVVILIIYSCNPIEEVDITGKWRFENLPKNEVIQPFKLHYLDDCPEFYSCYEVLYITENEIEQPLIAGKEGFELSRKFIEYEIVGDNIILHKDSLSYDYDLELSNEAMCFEKGKFCLEKINSTETSIDSTILRFEVAQEILPSFSVWLNHKYLQDSTSCTLSFNNKDKIYKSKEIELKEFEIDYILKLLERIPESQLNKIYNNGLSDCREISIDFYASNGRWMGIETCGLKGENPFEIRAFTTNLLWIMRKHLYKK